MTIETSPNSLDGTADHWRANVTAVHFVNGDPNFAGVAAASLATTAFAAADVTSENGAISGRAARLGAKPTMPITAGGVANHVVYVSGIEILHKTNVNPPVLLAASSTVDLPEVVYTVPQATAV